MSFASDRRKHRRHEVIWSGVMHLPDGTHVECAILDLSYEGAKVIVNEPLRRDLQVFFVSPRFEAVTARIAWTEGPTAGLQFLNGVDRVLDVLSGKNGDILMAKDVLTLLRGIARS
jgi:hypothetical protein